LLNNRDSKSINTKQKAPIRLPRRSLQHSFARDLNTSCHHTSPELHLLVVALAHLIEVVTASRAVRWVAERMQRLSLTLRARLG
jgi:hypothetical protein